MTQQTLRLEADPFDELAPTYDASFTTTRLGTCLRAVVWQRLDEVFVGRGHILEIGCGTGEDAVYLANRGHEVLATDVSAPMLEVAQGKAECSGCTGRIEFRRVPMEHLGREFTGRQFDGVYSNFGVVNCTPRLDRVIAHLAPLLRPGAPLVWVVMGRHVPWEWAWYLAHGDWRKAFRRCKGHVTWRGMRIDYPRPKELTRMLEPHFTPVRCSALGFVLPPTYASHWMERSPRLFRALARLERMAHRWKPLAALADHYIMEARRGPAVVNA